MSPLAGLGNGGVAHLQQVLPALLLRFKDAHASIAQLPLVLAGFGSGCGDIRFGLGLRAFRQILPLRQNFAQRHVHQNAIDRV